MLLRKCWVFCFLGFYLNFYRYSPTPFWLCWKCSENAGIRTGASVGSNGRKRFTLLQKTYGTTKRISAVGSNARIINKASTIHPHHCSKILFQNEDSHSKKNLGCDSSLSLSKYRLVNPNLRYVRSTTKHNSSRTARGKKEASKIHPHHSSKILVQNEDSHSKNKFGSDSSLSLSKYRLVNPKNPIPSC